MKTLSGHVQESPWMGIANKQLELMGRYMIEFGMTPASRSRLTVADPRMDVGPVEIVLVDGKSARERLAEEINRRAGVITVEISETEAGVL